VRHSRLPARNWKLHAVREKALRLGFKVEFVRKVFGPRHVQDRIYINGRRCHLKAAFSQNMADGADRGSLDLRVPENVWAEFLIYVPPPAAQRQEPFFIVPRSRLSDSALKTAEQFSAYAEGWHLLDRSEDACEASYSSLSQAPAGASADPHSRSGHLPGEGVEHRA